MGFWPSHFTECMQYMAQKKEEKATEKSLLPPFLGTEKRTEKEVAALSSE
jgi:hypothetical protein